MKRKILAAVCAVLLAAAVVPGMAWAARNSISYDNGYAAGVLKGRQTERSSMEAELARAKADFEAVQEELVGTQAELKKSKDELTDLKAELESVKAESERKLDDVRHKCIAGAIALTCIAVLATYAITSYANGKYKKQSEKTVFSVIVFALVCGVLALLFWLLREEGGNVRWKSIAWFSGLWVVGKLVYAFFGTQISITTRCARKLFDMVKNDHEYWFPDSCDKYLKSVVRKNRIIIAVAFIVVILFLPMAGAVGFILGYVITVLTSRKQTGVSEDNLKESIAIFLRFARPNMRDEFAERVFYAAATLDTETIYKSF